MTLRPSVSIARAPALLLAFALALSVPSSSHASGPYRLGPARVGGPPARVITLAPSLTEVVLDLGQGERLVGVTRHDDAPEVARLPRVGGFVDPSAERILALRPDLLLVQPSPGNRAVVERLGRLGVPVLVVPLDSLQEIHRAVLAIAEALGVEEAGRGLVARIDAELEAVRKRAAPLRPVETLVVYGWSPLVVAGPGSYADELIRLAGGRNAAATARGAFPSLPHETALAMDPQVVIDATSGHGEGTRPLGWEGRVRQVEGATLARPGTRVARAAEQLFHLLHGAPGVQDEASGAGQAPPRAAETPARASKETAR